MKIKKTETTCAICGDLVQHERNGAKAYITLFCDGHRYSDKFHICYQCLHDLGTLVKELREEKR